MMRYRLYATTGDDEDKLIYEDDDFLKVAYKMISCDEYSMYLLEYRSEMVSEVEYVYYPKEQWVVDVGYTAKISMHVDAFIAYLETLDGGEG